MSPWLDRRGLAGKEQPLARRLTPPGIQRGVRWGHLLQEESLLESATEASAEVVQQVESAAPVTPAASPDRMAMLEEKIESLEKRIEILEQNQDS